MSLAQRIILEIRVFETCKIEIRTGGEGALRRSFLPATVSHRPGGERAGAGSRRRGGAPHTLIQPWEKREQWPVESPQGGAATEPSRPALYGPREQEKCCGC